MAAYYLSFYVIWLLLCIHQLHLEAHLHLLRLFWLLWLFVDYMDGKKNFEASQCCKNTQKLYLTKGKYAVFKYYYFCIYNKMKNSKRITNFHLT